MASYNHHHLEADLMLLGWIVLIITVVGILLIIRANLYYQASIWEIDLEVGWSYSNLHLGFPSPQCEFHLQYQRCQMISDTYLYYQIFRDTIWNQIAFRERWLFGVLWSLRAFWWLEGSPMDSETTSLGYLTIKKRFLFIQQTNNYFNWFKD